MIAENKNQDIEGRFWLFDLLALTTISELLAFIDCIPDA
jgi:hypothetical protein